jgi:hypothetical protein
VRACLSEGVGICKTAKPFGCGVVPSGASRQRQRWDEMDTVSIFAIGCLILALAAGVVGAIVGNYQLFLVGSIVAIISAITIFIVIAIETRERR